MNLQMHFKSFPTLCHAINVLALFDSNKAPTIIQENVTFHLNSKIGSPLVFLKQLFVGLTTSRFTNEGWSD
ncbi:uncharacterized protein PHALS_15379 [Plasmopara halstedii]|uniref:Uncharacterized protein n=1 Tax=Plasmopara halstedii TaxID=4781 RepID=A0A0N7L4Q7_PLAHL|nr:uncharacterized protein PHALS_15379 [Plasmopara halstedii]CEG39347.1 hypothetical protein PHALS_15379 [Plasmopara halstedii]|eukprot:XP_024575716.1 hypothetical protein PHALS_15379 [Plasmopara halstedii]